MLALFCLVRLLVEVLTSEDFQVLRKQTSSQRPFFDGFQTLAFQEPPKTHCSGTKNCCWPDACQRVPRGAWADIFYQAIACATVQFVSKSYLYEIFRDLVRILLCRVWFPPLMDSVGSPLSAIARARRTFIW